MTEFDFFYQLIPDIAEMIVYQRKRTQEQRMQWKKDCMEYAKSLNPFACGFIRKTLRVIDNYLEKDEGVRMMKIDNIKIYPCFASSTPRAKKMEQKEWLYSKSGMSEFDIVLDRNNYLIDGYIGYLIAKENGLTHIPVRYGRRQIIKGVQYIRPAARCTPGSFRGYWWIMSQ